MFVVDRFVGKHLTLIDKERDAEIEETRALVEKLPAKELQRRGVCLLKLRIAGRRTGLYGRVLVQFESSHADNELPSHNFTPGDIAALSLSQAESSAEDFGTGIVTKVNQSSITIAFDDTHDVFSLGDEDQYKVTKVANDVTYKRLKRALTNLKTLQYAPVSRLVAALFGESEISPPSKEFDINFFNNRLDDSQKEAVRFALCQREIAVVHGPPGTGKTTTVIEIILQAIKQGLKILACAPSNIAVDNIVERLVSHKQKVVRIGHPARVLPHIQRFSLDAILSGSEEAKLVQDVRKDLDKSLSKLRKTKDKGEKQKLREDMRFLRKELVQREEAATKGILKRADVVLSTLTSATKDGPLKLLDEGHFDLVFIDECSQSLEAACWIALLQAPRCVLAGDHLQLPPTILSQEAAKNGLEQTLMERVLELHGNRIMRMLTMQYRMNEKIMRWSSVQLYNGKLMAHDSVKSHLLNGMQGVADVEETCTPLLLVDTAGCDLYELDVPEEVSKGNEGEADIVTAHVETLISAGMKPEDIAVIAPYNLQVELLRIRLSHSYPNLEIKSVDGFQGREKEAVVMCLVRSNPRGEVGFLAERRRINVAVTRARRHLAVVCNSETVCHDDFLQSLMDYLMSAGEVRTAQQYIEDGKVNQSLARPDHLQDLLAIPGTGHVKGTKARTLKKDGKNRVKEKASKSEGFRRGTEHRVKTESEKQAEREEKLAKFQAVLDQFMADLDEDVFEFPACITSYDRLLVHEVAEKMGLLHISKGSGDDRHIVLSKPGAAHESEEGKITVSGDMNSQSNQPILPSTSDSLTNDQRDSLSQLQENEEGAAGYDEEKAVKPQKNRILCSYCGKDVIKRNFQMHELHCMRKQKEQASRMLDKKAHQNAQREKNAKINQSINRINAKLDKAEELNELLSAVDKIDNVCNFKKCKKSILTLGQTCEFCNRRFCLSHHIPEVHGCGDLARAQARATVLKEGIIYRGGGVPDKRPDPERKAILHKKLENKLTDMASQRKGKPPSSKK